MNMKKTLAGLMAGVVAISAMATVAVSAKAQEGKTKTWTTSWTEKETASSKAAKVAVTLTPKTPGTTDAWAKGEILTITGVNGVKVDSIIKIVNRTEGSVEQITEDWDMYLEIVKDSDDKNTNQIKFISDVPSNLDGSTIEIQFNVKADAEIGAGVFDGNVTLAQGTATTASEAEVTSVANAAAKVEEKTVEKGIVINGGDWDNVVELSDGVWYTKYLDSAINEQGLAAADDKNAVAKKLAVAEPTEELMDYMADAKGAEITFTFLKKEMKTADSTVTFDDWADRYNWDSSSAKSAISLRVNNSNVLSVAMKEFDSDKFAATFSWDEVMAKFQGGSYTGLVNNLGFKVDNSKLPKDEDGNAIILEIASITVKIPEMTETEDDTMVEDIVKDFAAGESATVVEDTLPAATDAPAADAPAAPATTDAAANPETGNSAAALLAIPAALAAAAIVAKKRG